ncbi:MAG: hypothetical protein DRQ88_03355 [Epsilonproteobacteria bacterium]|nr:MAG: hypothetical protein DRQ89_01405 [Campylobacterota bacterium]RLA67356.1 MAG: hypothetical protein DRQ88_03355 [Campylobacterota bacterium]
MKKILKNEKGVALLLIMSSITILTYVLADFTFGTKLNKIRIQNVQDKLQAKLNVEAGLLLTLGKLKVYKDAWNLLEKNPSLKEKIDPTLLTNIILMPFIYPIPLTKSANLIQKGAIEEFHKDLHLPGTLHIFTNVVSGFININNLIIQKKKKEDQDKKEEYENEEEEEEESSDPIHVNIEKKIIEAIAQIMNDKKENDEEFDLVYGSLEPEKLVRELKYYVNNPKNYEEADKAQVDAVFVENDITPKHAPLTSLDELYLLPSWPDTIVDLIKDQLSVHEVSVIPLNEINDAQLRLIFPDINDDQIKDFFKYRDGSEEEKLEPNPFKSESEFKSYIIDDLGLVDDTTYKKNLQKLAEAGLVLGIAGKLFKVIIKGGYGRAIYKLTAYIDLPIKPTPKKKKKKKEEEREEEKEEEKEPIANDEEDDKKKKKEPPPKILLEPRVVELKIG